ncbi:MAG TPA: hypothetical protein VM755_13445 [Stellaceae bacterium]|nr:hypothetical protein [Stellaceae bacterium]
MLPGLYALFGLLTISPLFWVRVPALVDYPNHLARMWILAQHGQFPALSANYLVAWRILPDLAMDLIVPPLTRIISIETAGRVFVALTMLALIAGTATLHRVLNGRWALWPLWSALFVYNAVLFWGFLNCLFGVGACLFALAGWIATHEWRMAPRILVFAGVASLLLLLHLFAFGLYGLSVALYEIGERIRTRRLSLPSFLSLIAAGLQFLPGMALWYVSLEHSGSTVTTYGSLADKLYALISPFAFGYLPVPFDGAVGLLAVAFLGLALPSRSLRVAAQFRIPLAGLALAALVMPNVLSGSWGADMRLPVALPFLLIAASRFTAPQPRAAVIFAAFALAVLGLRVWSVTQSWRDYDGRFAEFRSAARVIAPGSRLMIVERLASGRIMPLVGVPAGFAVLQRVAFIHMAALSVIDRSAFVPYLFTGWTTIAVAPGNRRIAQRVGLPATPGELRKSADPETSEKLDTGPDIYGERPYWRDWPKRFDYVLWIDFGSPPTRVPRQLRLSARGSFFDIYRVERPALR